MIEKSISKFQLPVSSSELSTQPSTILTELPIYDATANLSTTNLLVLSTCYLSTAVPTHLSAAASDNLSAPTNSNTAIELTLKWNPKAETNTTKLEIIDSSLLTNPQFLHTTIRILTMEFRHQNYLSLLVIPEDATSNKSEANQKPLTNNILPTTIIENKLLTTIFSFEFEEPVEMLLFSGAALESKLITAMYTNAKVDKQHIKLILNNGSAGSIITRQLMDCYQVDHTTSACIITADRMTKTPIGEIDDFPFKVNNIIIPIKILIWQIVNTKVEGTTSSKILEIKNNSPEPVNIVLIPNPDIFLDLKTGPEEFYKHYQNLAPTREEQEQHLEEINTQLCDHCLIPCDFQYCNECDLIYNPPPCMIYMILEEDKPINNCALELKSIFNPNSNSDNDDNKNNGSSSTQNDNGNNNNSDSNSNSETFITLLDLTKEQEFKWFNNNNEGIMSEQVHDTDAGFDLRYSEKDPIKLESHSHTCINLKIALEIPATIMVQLAFRSSLTKKRINIRGGIIDTRYIGNIIAMLQNNLKKAYTIDPNKKIAQRRIKITVREIQRFEFIGKIDVPVNITEEEVIDKKEIISTCQLISIPPYDWYIVIIEKKVKNQVQMFEAETQLCKSGEIGLINLHIPAKNHSHIKISIYNNTGNIMEIPKGITIGYLTTEIKEQPPNPILDFP
ncbi:hypothetical protein G9A89_013136 [Geosiphon pyriformis]|nr:hypothetical protein G9A89_013136 [Geosiphon pyriformis]